MKEEYSKYKKEQIALKTLNYTFEDYLNEGYYSLHRIKKHYPNSNPFHYLYEIYYGKNFNTLKSNYRLFEPKNTYPIYQEYLVEALRSHDISKFFNFLYKECLTITDESEVFSSGILTLIVSDFSDNDKIEELCRRFGYHIIDKGEDEIKRKYYVIESTFGYVDVSEDVYYTGILYHITKKSVLNKILRIGLCPRHLDKKVSHPDRIYALYDDTNKEEIKRMGNCLYPNDEFTILKIDLNKVPHSNKLKFFVDPAYDEFGVFTCENIPPQCIEEINIDNFQE